MKRIIAAVLLALMLCLGFAEEIDTSQIADAGDQIAAADVLEEGMTPVTSDQLNEGTYPVEVNSSSSMFKIASATVTVGEDGLTAELIIASDSYRFLYPGLPEEAAKAPREALVEAEPLEDGGNRYVFPIEALDGQVNCAAFSINKLKWYPRTLVFRADSLPAEAFKEEKGIDLDDGEYTIDVALNGGSGKTQVESPAKLVVEGGAAKVTIAFNTAKIDYLLVDGETFLPEQQEGNAVFTIPVATLVRPTAIEADSTVMKPATLVSYTLVFDKDSIQ